MISTSLSTHVFAQFGMKSPVQDTSTLCVCILIVWYFINCLSSPSPPCMLYQHHVLDVMQGWWIMKANKCLMRSSKSSSAIFICSTFIYNILPKEYFFCMHLYYKMTVYTVIISAWLFLMTSSHVQSGQYIKAASGQQ